MTHSAGNHEPGAGEISAEIEFMAAERLIFFSDAVTAIAITLLVFGLPLPHGATNSEVLHSMSRDLGDYLAFLISFVAIGSHWRMHHRRAVGRWRFRRLLQLLSHYPDHHRAVLLLCWLAAPTFMRGVRDLRSRPRSSGDAP